MRAFLREPSTPWIVFDQDGRPPSQLAVGEMLPGRPAVLSEHGFFTATAAIDAVALKQVEPSSLAVAADLVGEEPKHARGFGADDSSIAIPMRGVSGRLVRGAVVLLSALAVFAIGAVALRSASHQIGSAHKSNAAAAPHAAGASDSDPVDAPPPDFDVSAAAAKLTAAAQAANASTPAAAPAAPAREDAAKAAAKRYGRLTVAGDARAKDVFMDGKRMLGRGARSFTIMCGTHSIAVGTKADAHDVDIPCTGSGEIVVGK